MNNHANNQDISSGMFLIFSSQARLCALPLEHVVETMRALPVDAIPAMPTFMLGVSIIRGMAVPVVSVASLLGGSHADTQAQRYITVRLEGRQLAFAVDMVLGIHNLSAANIEDIPPLLSDIDSRILAGISTLDAGLLLILQGSHLLSEQVWHILDAQKEPQ